jgi:hypothetical protein
MPLPQLNTGGLDISNTLLKIKQMENIDENQNLRNALLDAKKPDPETVRLQNELKQEEIKVKRLESLTKLNDLAREGLNWVQANVEQGDPSAYSAYRKHMVEGMGLPQEGFPEDDTFYDSKPDASNPEGVTKVFNKDRFNKWAFRSLATSSEMVKNRFQVEGENKTIYGPGGKSMTVFVKKGEMFNPEEIGLGWSLEKPGEPKAPTVLTHQEGDQNVSRQWDPATQTMKEIGRGPKWNEKEKDRWSKPYAGPDGAMLQRNEA